MRLRGDLENFINEYENDLSAYLEKNPYSNEIYYLIELKEVYTRSLECYNFRLAYDLKSHKRNILLGSYLEYSNNKNKETTIFAKELKPKILVIIKHIENLLIENNNLNIEQKENLNKYNKSIFKNEYASLLFDYFLDNYITEDKSKYIQIYRYLESDIICSQEKFRTYIKGLTGVSISKITTINFSDQLILKEREREFKKVYNIDK